MKFCLYVEIFRILSYSDITLIIINNKTKLRSQKEFIAYCNANLNNKFNTSLQWTLLSFDTQNCIQY
jgi:hypothetical protein